MAATRSQDTGRTLEEYRADEATIASIRTHIADLKTKTEQLQLEHEAIDEQLTDILTDRLLGRRVSSDTLKKLETQKRENESERDQTARMLEGLQSRLDEYHEQERARLATIHRHELLAVSREVGPAQEAVFQAIRTLGDAYDVFFETRDRFNRVKSEFERYGTIDERDGINYPREPMFEIPRDYMVHGYGRETSLRDHLDKWIEAPRIAHEEFIARITHEARLAEEAKEQGLTAFRLGAPGALPLRVDW